MINQIFTQLEIRNNELASSVVVLIDAENVNPTVAEFAIKTSASYGNVDLIQSFGDWTSRVGNVCNRGWQELVEIYNLQRVQVDRHRNGKNATDIALVIQGVNLNLVQHYTNFVIVSNDCDFLHLVRFLRNQECTVIGVGLEPAVISFHSAYSAFISYIADEKSAIEVTAPTEIDEKLSKIETLILEACVTLNGENKWIMLSKIGEYIRYEKLNKNFVKDYGKLLTLVKKMKTVLLLKKEGNTHFVKIR